MKRQQPYVGLISALFLLLAVVLGCGQGSKPTAEWTKAKKIAGKEQKLSHVSGLAVDQFFAYVTIGGTLADQKEGTSGLRKVALDSGVVKVLDPGKNLPQSESGGIAIDDKYVYWNAGGSIQRILKDGGDPETVASENVGIGIDLAIDGEKVYWANHGYYSPNSPINPSPIYAVSKQGGMAEVFADQQKIPNNLVLDDKYVYWLTATGISKKAKSGGQPQVVLEISDKEGVDVMSQDADNLYFGFRGAGESRWALRRVSKQGGQPQTLVKTFSLKPFVIDDTNVYFFDEQGLNLDAFCKVSKNGGEVTRLDTGYTGGTIAQSKTQVYFGSLDDIYSFQK